MKRLALLAAVAMAAACSSGSGGSAPSVPSSQSQPESQSQPQSQSQSTTAEVPVGADAATASAEAETSEAETSEVETSEVETSEVETSEAEPSEVETSEVEEDDEGKDVVTRSADAVGEGILPEGVGSVTARVTSAAGDVCEVCLWLADDDASRQRGLMGVTDLGDAVGMAFRWEEPRTGNFFMFQTPTPLSIAWFDDAGSHVGQADMDPCLVDNSATCERYTADSPYMLAVEMFGGQLGSIGIGPGATIELIDLACA